MSLCHAEIFLFLNPDCLLQGIKFQPKEIGHDKAVCETLHEQREQRLFIRQIGCDATRKMSYVLNVRVYITFALFEFQEFIESPELSVSNVCLSRDLNTSNDPIQKSRVA